LKYAAQRPMTCSAAGAAAQPAATFVTLNWQVPQYDLSTQNYPADIHLTIQRNTTAQGDGKGIAQPFPHFLACQLTNSVGGNPSCAPGVNLPNLFGQRVAEFLS
jgi:hypothetical protein